MQVSSQVLDRITASFDDEHAVAAAGLILPATTSQQLELEQATDELVGVRARHSLSPAGRRSGRN